MLPGVRIYNFKRNIDERGFFIEILRTDWKDFIEDDKIVQINLSFSHYGIIRAWHRHLRGQVDYVTVVKGKIKLCIYDGRKESSTYGELNEFIISDKEPRIIRVPGLYWHGTKCLDAEGSLVIYCMNRLYDYENPDEERIASNSKIIMNRYTNKLHEW